MIVSGSEDGTIKIWNSGTYRLGHAMSNAFERAWYITIRLQGNEVAVVMVKLGRNEPSYSMNPSGKQVYTRNTEVLSATLQGAAEDETTEGQQITLSVRWRSSRCPCNTLPTGASSPWSEAEYIIFTALAWPNKAFVGGFSFAFHRAGSREFLRHN